MAFNYDNTSNNLALRFRNALNAPHITFRINEVLNVFKECTLKEQQVFFTQLVDSIFGTSPGNTGWNIKGLYRSSQYGDFESVTNFLHPQGPLFDIAYRLLCDVYTKFEYNVVNLPSNLRSVVDQQILPSFFTDKLYKDPATLQPLALRLNSFEYYMFHFAFYLVSPWQQSTVDYNYEESAYLHLAGVYLSHLLPIETSTVLPVVAITHLSPRTPPPPVTPVRVSKLFKPSALKMMMAASPPVSQPHAEIWRSELMLLIVIYFWLPIPDSGTSKLETVSPNSSMNSSGSYLQNTSTYSMEGQESRASLVHVRAVRALIRHVHFFANNIRNDGTAMDELRRSIRSALREPMHSFIWHNIHHWPLDSSLKYIIQAFLVYVQPWRYLRYQPGRCAGTSTTVLPVWSSFILENFSLYTKVIIQLISRFTRMDLSSPRHAQMVYSICKAISEPELPTLLYQADLAAQNRGDFDDLSLFTEITQRKVVELLIKIKQTITLVNEQEQAQLQQSPSSTLQIIHEWLFGTSSDDYNSTERQTTVAYLEKSSAWLCQVFRVDVPDVPDTVPATPVRPSKLDPVLAQKRAIFIKYGGNPDLLPIRSNELASLVRLLHRISTSVNEIHGPKIAELWHRQNLTGRICRQLLAPPCQIHQFYKTGPGNPAPLVTSMLPPRVCLRPLASRRLLFFVSFLALIPHLFGWSSQLFYFCCVFLCWTVLVAKAAIAPYLSNDSKPQEHEPFIPLDMSFND